MNPIPPLNQLKAFEAAGRLGSFKAAANELAVSEAAISQHIRSLESYLGAPLFLRTYSGVVLTEAGAAYAAQLSQAFDIIKAASSQFRASELKGALRLSIAPSLGNRWLLPRLAKFSALYPDILVEPILSPNLIRLGNDADIAIRHGNGSWTDAQATLLKNESLVPVASPSLLSRQRLQVADSVLDYPLLTAANRKAEWSHWLISQGVRVTPGQRYVTYDTIALAIDAAISGVGICLIDRSLIASDLKNRRLKIAFNKGVEGLKSYYILMAKTGTPDPKAEIFKAWLLQQAAEDARSD